MISKAQPNTCWNCLSIPKWQKKLFLMCQIIWLLNLKHLKHHLLLAFTCHALVTNAQYPGYYYIWQNHTSKPTYCVPLELWWNFTCSVDIGLQWVNVSVSNWHWIAFFFLLVHTNEQFIQLWCNTTETHNKNTENPQPNSDRLEDIWRVVPRCWCKSNDIIRSEADIEMILNHNPHYTC